MNKESDFYGQHEIVETSAAVRKIDYVLSVLASWIPIDLAFEFCDRSA